MIPYSHLPYIVLATVAITTIMMMLFFQFRKAYKRAITEIEPVEVLNGPGVSMQVWQAVYQQSAETLRDQAKLLASTNIAGLAGAIAIMSSKDPSPNAGWLIASVSVFGLGLIVSLMPITGLADKFKEDLSAAMEAMKNQTSTTIQIRHPFALGKKFYVGMLSLSCSGLGIFCLTSALLP